LTKYKIFSLDTTHLNPEGGLGALEENRRDVNVLSFFFVSGSVMKSGAMMGKEMR